MAATNVQAFPGDVVIPGKQYAIELQADLAEADKSATTWYRLLKGNLRDGSNGRSTQCELLVIAPGLHECVTFDFNYMIQLVGAGGCGLNVYRHDTFFSRVGIVKFRLTEYANYVFYLDMKIVPDVVLVERTWTVNLKVVQGGSAVEAPTTFLEKITSYTNIVAHREYDIGLSAFTVMPTSNAAPFSIMSSGNVGIGTTNPTSMLQVGTGGSATSGAAPGSITVTGTGATKSTGGKPGLYHRASVGLGLWSDAHMSMEVNGTSGSPLEAIRIKSDGKLGIGTVAPLSRLVVTQDFGGSGPGVPMANVVADDGGVQFGIHVGEKVASPFSRTPLRVVDSGETVLIVDGHNKRVGIGTQTPGQKLSIYTGSTTVAGLSIDRFSSGNYRTDFLQADTGLAIHVGNASDAPTEKMRIHHNGNVGIGSTTPGSKLNVAGTVGTTDQISVSKSATYSKLMRLGVSSGGTGMNFFVGSGGGAPNWASTGIPLTVNNSGGGTILFISNLNYTGGNGTQSHFHMIRQRYDGGTDTEAIKIINGGGVQFQNSSNYLQYRFTTNGNGHFYAIHCD